MNSYQKIRARIILVGIGIGAVILVVALYYIQIVNGQEYANKADKQYTKPINVSFDRGTIYFLSKSGDKVAAASVERGYTAFINPKLISDPDEAYEAVSQFLKIDKGSFVQMASKKNDPYEEIAKKINKDIADSITALGLKGVGVTKDSWRYYPGGSLATHALGLVGESKDSSNIEGKYGIERYYDRFLKRDDVSSESHLFAQLFSDVRDTILGSGKSDEADVVTTIEPTVEAYLTKIIEETNTTWHPDEIGAIVMDPKTGKIVAMVSLPTYNPNDISGIKNTSVLSNPLVEHVYELGSIMKPLTLAMGLDSGAIDPGYTYEDEGCMLLDEKKICNFDQKARGKADLQTVISQSLNVGVANIALKAGADRVREYFGLYGLDRKTNIDLPNEAASLLGNLKSGRDIEIATAAYGQGVAVSPIGMTRALATLANGGYLIEPYLVERIEYEDGRIDREVKDENSRVLKEQTFDDVTKILVKVVDEVLRNGQIKMSKYSIAAKTGTAQIPDPKNGGYYGDRYLHSFFGYFPAYDAKFLVFMYQIHPKGAQYASETLSDPFASIAKFLINYYDVAPDR